MAKTVFSSTYYGLVFGYGVNTTVVSASHIPGGSHYEGDPPVLVQDPPIGVKVYPMAQKTPLQTQPLRFFSGGPALY